MSFRVSIKKGSMVVKKYVWMFFSVFICMFALLSGIYGSTIKSNLQNKTPYPFYNGNDVLIAHAGGRIGGKVYTNSLEAIEGSIKGGRKLIEVDFIKTSDDVYVAGHDWELVNKMTGHEERGDAPLSYKAFMGSKIYGQYTPIDAQKVADLMKQYPDWVLLTDKVRDIKHMAKLFPQHDRVIFQVYGLIGYIRALKAGFIYPTLRLKGGRRGVKEIYKVFMDWLNVKSVILGEKSFNKNLDYIGELHNNGTTVILYGNPSFKIVENAEEIKKYRGKYIDLVDSDSLISLD